MRVSTSTGVDRPTSEATSQRAGQVPMCPIMDIPTDTSVNARMATPTPVLVGDTAQGAVLLPPADYACHPLLERDPDWIDDVLNHPYAR